MTKKLQSAARKAATNFVLGYYKNWRDDTSLTRAKLGVMSLAARPSVSLEHFTTAGSLMECEGRHGTIYENHDPAVIRAEIHALTDLLVGFAKDQQPKKKG